MLLPVYTRQFSKDIKKLQRSGQPLEDVKTVMRNLIAEIALPAKYRDHRLTSSLIYIESYIHVSIITINLTGKILWNEA